MATKKRTTATAEKVAEHSHSDLEKKVAALQKEVAALKKELAKGSGGEDPRVSKIWEALQSFPKFHKFLNK